MREEEKNYKEFLKRKNLEKKERHQEYADMMAKIAEKQGKVKEAQRMRDIKAKNAYL